MRNNTNNILFSIISILDFKEPLSEKHKNSPCQIVLMGLQTRAVDGLLSPPCGTFWN